MGRSLALSTSVVGGAILRYRSISRAMLSRSLTPSANRMRRQLPKALIKTGMAEPSTVSNNSALPPSGLLDTRSVISAISRRGETGSAMRTSSPSASSRSINSLRDS